MRKVLFAVCAFALAVCFASCSGKGSAAGNSADAGNYKLIESGGEDATVLEALGMTATMTLKADGTGSIDLFGMKSDLKWDGNKHEITIVEDGGTSPYKIDGKKLIITEGGQQMVFEKQ